MINQLIEEKNYWLLKKEITFELIYVTLEHKTSRK